MGLGGMPPKQALIDLDLDFQLVSASVLVLVSGCALWRRVLLSVAGGATELVH